MKMFQLAIASIVDANTGYGLSHGSGRTDYREEEMRSRALRSKSVHAFLGAIGGMFRDLLANHRERVRQRKALTELLHLNDHYLADIGLTRGDITAVRLGQTSLDVLNEDRRARLSVEPLDYVATGEIEDAARVAAVNNEAAYDEAKCA